MNDNKPDDCYELQQFRNFRDNWLSKQEDGQELINRYYFLAPRIVKLIDSSNEKQQVYNEIKKEYIEPCLKYLEKNEYDLCKKRYVQMVSALAERYILWG